MLPGTLRNMVPKCQLLYPVGTGKSMEASSRGPFHVHQGKPQHPQWAFYSLHQIIHWSRREDLLVKVASLTQSFGSSGGGLFWPTFLWCHSLPHSPHPEKACCRTYHKLWCKVVFLTLRHSTNVLSSPSAINMLYNTFTTPRLQS